MYDKYNGRKPQWKTISMEDILKGRQPEWKTTSIEDNLNGNGFSGRLKKPNRKMTIQLENSNSPSKLLQSRILTQLSLSLELLSPSLLTGVVEQSHIILLLSSRYLLKHAEI
jgi:hypothetical protein